jgi:hypothetical protein
MIRLRTRIAKTGWGDHRFMGYGVYADLLGRTSLAQLLALSLGVELDTDEGEFLDEIFVTCLLADPHVWPLKLSRVATAHGGSTMTGVCAGLLAFEGPVTGTGPAAAVAKILVRLAELDPDQAAEEIESLFASRRRVPGFGVPARPIDERVVALGRRVAARQRETLPHWVTWSRLAEYARSRGVEPNIGSAFAAVTLDLGFPVHRIEPLFAMALLFCLLPNAVEGQEQRPPILCEVPHEALVYVGPPRRPSSRALTSPG